jgi:stringent starvation protein B
VSVPDRLAGDPRLVLRFGYGLSPAIVDLEVGEDGLSGVLSFSGAPHRCVLPWPSIYAVVSEADQRGLLWPSDVPPEAVASVEPEQQSAETKAEAEAEDTPARRSRGHLKLVD